MLKNGKRKKGIKRHIKKRDQNSEERAKVNQDCRGRVIRKKDCEISKRNL